MLGTKLDNYVKIFSKETMKKCCENKTESRGRKQIFLGLNSSHSK